MEYPHKHIKHTALVSLKGLGFLLENESIIPLYNVIEIFKICNHDGTVSQEDRRKLVNTMDPVSTRGENAPNGIMLEGDCEPWIKIEFKINGNNAR